jgi:HEAT repeat protein
MSAPKRLDRVLQFAPFVVALGLLFYALASLPPREPRYEGKPLHYWLARIHDGSLPRSKQVKTEAAITCIGTNNLQLLLKWFREAEPSYAEPAYRKAINRVLSRQRWVRFRLETKFRWSRPFMAYAVFTQYPQVAGQAVLQFIAMLNDKDDLTKGKACMVLGFIGKPAMPALLSSLSHTNDMTRALAAAALGKMGTNAAHVRTNLEAVLSDRTMFVRMDAAEALGEVGGDPEIVVPVLLQCVHQGDGDTRTYALLALAHLKERAKSAVPDLTNSLATVTNIDAHSALLDALMEIDPATAARFQPPKPSAMSTEPFDQPTTDSAQETPSAEP